MIRELYKDKNDIELVAVLAAILRAGDSSDEYVTADVVDEAEFLLAAVKQRAIEANSGE